MNTYNCLAYNEHTAKGQESYEEFTVQCFTKAFAWALARDYIADNYDECRLIDVVLESDVILM